jgi:Domain of unknown function (DUF4260)
MLERLPRWLLRLEGLAVFSGALALYLDADYGWVLFVVLALAPDLSMLGYLAGPRRGAASYNIAHTYALPVTLGATGVLADWRVAVQLALIGLAHIGIDRFLGYGLKYPADFKDTHLQHV